MAAILALALVLVLPTGAEDEAGLVEALRIQLAGVARVEQGPAVEGDTVGARVDHAATLVESGDATLAVFVERGPVFVLYVVGRQRGRAIVEVFRIPGQPGPETERALALKVGDVLDTLLAPPEEQAPVSAWVQEEDPKPARPSRSVQVLAEAGPMLAVGSAGTQLGASVAFGASVTLRRFVVEPVVQFRWASGLSATEPVGTVEVDERDLAIGVRVVRPRGKWSLGGSVLVGGRFLSATGRTAAGAEGSETVVVPALDVGVEARWGLGRDLDLRAGLTLDLSLLTQRFAVNGTEVVDMGEARGIADLALTWRFL